MIYRAKIGDYEMLLDDEITEMRPTPEHAADYLHRCAVEVLALYTAADSALEQGD